MHDGYDDNEDDQGKEETEQNGPTGGILLAARLGNLATGEFHELVTGVGDTLVIVFFLESRNHLVIDDAATIGVRNGPFETIADLDGHFSPAVAVLGLNQHHDTVVDGLSDTPFAAELEGEFLHGIAVQGTHRHDGNLVGRRVIKGDEDLFQFIGTVSKHAREVIDQARWIRRGGDAPLHGLGRLRGRGSG